jgi:hypothetical protein
LVLSAQSLCPDILGMLNLSQASQNYETENMRAKVDRQRIRAQAERSTGRRGARTQSRT